MNIEFRMPWWRVTRDGTCPACSSGARDMMVVQTGDDMVWVTCESCDWQSTVYEHIGSEETPFTVLFDSDTVTLQEAGAVLADGTAIDTHGSYRIVSHEQVI